MCHSTEGPYVQEVKAALVSLGINVSIHIFSDNKDPPILLAQDVIFLLDLEESLVHGFSQTSFISMKAFLTELRTKLIWAIPAPRSNATTRGPL